jgi:hypothetical protein
MVKTGTERSDKYGQKYDPEVVRSRYTATSDSAKAKQVVRQELMAGYNAEVRNILNTKGIYPILTIPFQAFGNKLVGICRKFANLDTTPTSSLTARNVALLEFDKFVTYLGGEVEANLTNVQALMEVWDLFGTMIGESPSPDI